MDKLEKLTQDESGKLYHANGAKTIPEFTIPIGKIRTLVLANPCLDVSNEIDKMTERNSFFIPKGANAYVASDFNGDTQHLRESDLEGSKKSYSVFAVQFYQFI